MRSELVDFVNSQGFPCSGQVVEYQPFLFDVWRALSLATCDVDCALPGILAEGVPTGILHPIEPSGVIMGRILRIHSR